VNLFSQLENRINWLQEEVGASNVKTEVVVGGGKRG
jgi:hypothetical protein